MFFNIQKAYDMINREKVLGEHEEISIKGRIFTFLLKFVEIQRINKINKSNYIEDQINLFRDTLRQQTEFAIPSVIINEMIKYLHNRIR